MDAVEEVTIKIKVKESARPVMPAIVVSSSVTVF